ncbi:ESPR-type extended signal peptide-containing protein [Acidaminococcus sp.]|uniref:ESPR-type extended signal peptide-containing protein n=1 Tax=Acidaminococcus sp. TaxID=1872103 RepID=UPI003D7D6BF0
MNKIYKVIWNKTRGMYMVVSELARNQSRGGGSVDKRRKLTQAAAALALFFSIFSAGGTALAADPLTIGTAEVNTASGDVVNVLTGNSGEASAINDALEQVKTNRQDIETNRNNIQDLKSSVSNTYVSKSDATVQDSDIVKSTSTIGDNVTKLDGALHDEIAKRIGADKAQDKLIAEINQNMADGFNTINTNVADGFGALNAADAAEKAARLGADTQLAEAVNSGLSLSDDNVLQKNSTTVHDDGSVTTSKTDASEVILNKDKTNQITMNDNGIKVGTNSSLMNADGVYTGGDTYDAAKAAMSADGKIKGAGGAFTVDDSGNVNSNATITGAAVTDGKGASMSNGTVTGKTLTDGKATINNGNIKTNGGFIQTGGGNVNTQGGEVRTNGGKIATSGGEINTGSGTIKTVGGDILTAGGKLNTSGGDIAAGTGDISGQNITATGTLKGDNLTVANGITGRNLTLTGGDLDAGAGTIKTTGQVNAGTLNVTDKATVKDLEVTGEFNAGTLKSKLDENNYTEISGGNVKSVNDKLDTATGQRHSSASTFDETGSNVLATDNDSIGKSTVTADSVKQSISDIGDNPWNSASRELHQNGENKYEITDSVAEGQNSNVTNKTAGQSENIIGDGTATNQSTFRQKIDRILQEIKSANGSTSVEQTDVNITNTAKDGTITNDAKDLVNKASDSITNQIGDGSAVKSVMDASGIANTATGGTISNSAADVINTGTNSVINKVGDNQVAVKTDNVKAAYGSDTSTTWDAKGITNTTSGDISNSAVNIINTATGDMTNTVGGKMLNDVTGDMENKVGGSLTTTVTNDSSLTAENINNTARNKITNDAKEIINKAATSIKDIVGKTTVTTTDGGTTFKNTDHDDPIEEGSITSTTISGNTVTTGQVTTDYAAVNNDLTVNGDSHLQGNVSVGKNLEVTGTSTFKDAVTMEKDLEVKGTTTTEKLAVKSGASITGGTTTDTLHVTGTSTFDGMVSFKDAVSIEKDLSVGGNATVAGDVSARSYKVAGKTYIDQNGINANSQKVTNVADGDVSEGSKDAVNGGQLYHTNQRVSTVENRMDGVENRVGRVENRVDNLDSRIDKVGASAAAMANLHPMDFDEDSKVSVAAAAGNYRSETAGALGVFYRPTDRVMLNVSTSFGNGENMVGGGVTFKLGKSSKRLQQAEATNEALSKQVTNLQNRLDALLGVLNPNLSKAFPDVPANHWAYEAVSRLAGNDIIKGYEDGKYHGDRTMTRYEMAEIIYNALSQGAKSEVRLVEEFRPELQAMAAQRKA